MKNYFAIAALLGVIAFASVSFLAQAADQQHAAASDNVAVQEKAEAKAARPEAAADTSEGEAAADEAESKPVSAKFDKDDQECMAASEAPKKDGSQPSDADKEDAYTKCMTSRGHTQAEITANGAGADVHDQGERAEE